jgi:hypothetical protein
LATALFAATALGASPAVLFPKPLHLVRTVEDPLARGTSTVDEYCVGNQVITVSGSRVAIADYDKQQLTEIDREAGTYSVTPFDAIARANAEMARGALAAKARGSAAATIGATSARAPKADAFKATALGVRAAAANGRPLDSWQLVREEANEKVTIDIGIDRRHALSRDAVEVLVGASYPSSRRDEHEALVRAASSGAREIGRRQPTGNSAAAEAPAADYGLPVEQVFTFENGGTKLVVRNSIVDVTDDAPPAALLIIPPGSQLVESRVARMARELREADELSISSPRP